MCPSFTAVAASYRLYLCLRQIIVTMPLRDSTVTEVTKTLLLAMCHNAEARSPLPTNLGTKPLSNAEYVLYKPASVSF